MGVSREEMQIVFGVDQTQLDNVLRVMPVKFHAAAKKSVDGFASEFKSLTSKLTGNLSDAFLGGFTGAALGSKIASKVQSLAEFVAEQASQRMTRAGEARRGSVRTGMDVETFQRVDNVFQKTIDGGLENALDRVADATAKAMEGGESGNKLTGALIELGASMETIQSGDYKQVFFQIANNMKSAELSAQKIAALRDVFGRNGGELILPFRKGFEGLLANTGIVDEKEVKSAKATKELAEQAGFAWGDIGASGVVKVFKDLPSLFKVGAADMLARLLPGRGGVIPDIAPNHFDQRDIDVLEEKRIEREKEKLKVLMEQEAVRKKAEEEKKKNEALDRQADQLDKDTADRAFALGQKQLKLEEAIAKAKEMQAIHEKRSADILKKKFQDITAQDRLEAAQEANLAKRAEQEAADKQKELDAHKKQFQEQADDLQKRVQKAEDSVARTYADRYGFTIAQLAGEEDGGMDLISGTRGHRGRRNARRALNSRSAAEQYDYETSREIQAERAWAKTMVKYGQYEEAQAANMRADELSKTLNFGKPSEMDWEHATREALEESRDALTELLKKADGEGIHIVPRMAP